MSGTTAPIIRAVRIRVFVDFWNFQLTLNERVGSSRGNPDLQFAIDYQKIGPWLAKKAAGVIPGAGQYSFDGMTIYTSYDPRKEGGKRFLNWVNSWLSKQPGVHVECRERKPKAPPKCPVCREEIRDCPHCSKPIQGSGEKGVDTLIATDMIRLAWEDAYDVAVLATSDRDLIPCAEFLRTKGLKVVHAAIPPKGADLTKASWASFDVFSACAEIERTIPASPPVKV